MKNIRKVFSLILVMFFIPFLFSCNNGISTYDLTAFSSPVHIETYDKVLSNDIKEQIKNYLSSLESSFSLNSQNSFTYKLKNANMGNEIDISPLEENIYNLSKTYSEFSNGKFTPLIYPLSNLWGFTEKGKTLSFSVPTDTQINEIKSSGALSFNNIAISNGKISKTANCVLDFGGILKGFASQMVAKILTDNGFAKGYVNIGSSSITILSIESLSIRHPRDTSSTIISIDCNRMENVNVSTSGDYENYRIKDDIRYSHIIDPATGRPQQTNIVSSTIICPNGAFADAMTTALCLMSFDVNNKENSELISFIKKIESEFNESSIFAIYNDGENKIIITNKTENVDFTLTDNSYSIYKVI